MEAEQKARHVFDNCAGIDPINETNARGILLISLPPQGRFQEALRQIPEFLHAISKVSDRYHLNRVPEGPFKHPIYVSYTAAVRALCSGDEGDIAQWVPTLQSIAADNSA